MRAAYILSYLQKAVHYHSTACTMTSSRPPRPLHERTRLTIWTPNLSPSCPRTLHITPLTIPAHPLRLRALCPGLCPRAAAVFRTSFFICRCAGAPVLCALLYHFSICCYICCVLLHVPRNPSWMIFNPCRTDMSGSLNVVCCEGLSDGARPPGEYESAVNYFVCCVL